MKKVCFMIAVMSLFAFTAMAGVPHMINYQGKLTDSSGTPLNGNYSICFRIYDAATDGTQLWEECHGSVSVQNGVFNVFLGSIIPVNLSDFNGQDLYLAIQVDTDPEMSPRQQIVSIGYALTAETVKGDDLYVDENGNVGIGTTAPQRKLHLEDVTNAAEIRMTDPAGVIADIGATSFDYEVLTQTNHPLSLGTNGKIDVTIQPNGNVGIGTTGPEVELHIVGTSATPGLALDTTNAGDQASLRFRAAGVTKWRVHNKGGDGDKLSFMDDGGIDLFVIQQNGNVGIGTTNPTEKLDVEGNVQAYAFLTGDIVFQKDGKKLWRMFEDEKGLYLENLSTGKVSRIFLEEDLAILEKKIEALSKKIAQLEDQR